MTENEAKNIMAVLKDALRGYEPSTYLTANISASMLLEAWDILCGDIPPTTQSSRPDNVCPEYHREVKKQGCSICPYCDKKLSSG